MFDILCSVANCCVHVLYISVILLLLFHYSVIVNCSDIDCIFMYVAGIISMNYDDNGSSATHLHMCSHWVLVQMRPFAVKTAWRRSRGRSRWSCSLKNRLVAWLCTYQCYAPLPPVRAV